MATYYIVKHHNSSDGEPRWKAHRRGRLSAVGVYSRDNEEFRVSSYQGADDCERQLRNVLSPIKPEVVRVVTIRKGG